MERIKLVGKFKKILNEFQALISQNTFKKTKIILRKKCLLKKTQIKRSEKSSKNNKCKNIFYIW